MEQSVVERLEVLLAQDHAAGKLVTCRTAIKRSHYAARIGCANAHLCKAGKAVFQKYDEVVASQSIKLVREFLDRHALAGTLIFSQGGINRNWIARELSISASPLAHPRFATLFKEYEKDRAIHNSIERNLVDRLRKELQNPNFPRNKCGLRVSITAVAKLIGTHPAKLRNEPFISIIRSHDERLKKGDFLQPGEVIANGKLRTFRALETHWPLHVLNRIAQCYQSAFGSSGERITYRLVLSLFAWIAKSKALPIASSYQALRAEKLPDQSTWGLVWDAAIERSKAKYKKKSPSTLNAELRRLRRIFVSFAHLGLFPDLPYPPPKFSNKLAQAKTRHRKTLVEARPLNAAEQPDPAMKASALVSTILKEGLDKEEFESEETATFLKVLQEEVAASEPPNDADIPELTKRVLDKRLGLITQAARKKIDEGKAYLLLGERLIQEAPFTRSSLESLLRAGEGRARLMLMRDWFPTEPAPSQRREVLANLLSISRLRYGGIAPSSITGNALDLPGLATSRLAVLTWKIGGRPTVMRYLAPDADAVVAVLVDYMVAAGANQAVAMSLPATCLQPTGEPGLLVVTGYKLRAGGKPIRNEFHENSDIAKNIRWLRDSLEHLRLTSDESEPNHQLLALVPRGVQFNSPSEPLFAACFEKLIRSIPELSKLKITPGMIRRSVVVLARLSSTDARISAAVANHSRPVNQIYSDLHPVRVQRDLGIRQFIDHLESTIVIQASSLVEALDGHNTEDIQKRVKQLESTGLGTLCKNRFGKPGLDGVECKEPRCAADLCPQMDVRLFPLEVARLQLWMNSLEKAEPEWERDRPERWHGIWLPLLCLILAIEEKCSRGTLLEAWDAGTAVRISLEAQPNFKPPMPW